MERCWANVICLRVTRVYFWLKHMDAYSLIFFIMKNTQKDKKALPACRQRTLMSAALFTYLPPLFTYLCAMSAKGCLPRKPRYIINTPKMTAHDNQSIWCLKMFVIWREITASHWRRVYESVLVNISCLKVTSRRADNRAAEVTAPLKLKGEVLQSKIR